MQTKYHSHAPSGCNDQLTEEERRVKIEKWRGKRKNRSQENLPVVRLIQAGSEEPAEGIQFLIILHIRHKPEVTEGYSGALVVLDHQGAFAMCFVGASHFPVDPGIVVDKVTVMVHG